MNQPTEDRLKHLEAEQLLLKEEVRKLREQATEPMKVTRIELDPGGIQNRLDNHAEMMKEISHQVDRHTAAFGQVMALLNAHTGAISELQANVSSIKATLSDHGEMLLSARNALDTVESTQEEHGEMLREILAQLKKGE